MGSSSEKNLAQKLLSVSSFGSSEPKQLDPYLEMDNFYFEFYHRYFDTLLKSVANQQNHQHQHYHHHHHHQHQLQAPYGGFSSTIPGILPQHSSSLMIMASAVQQNQLNQLNNNHQFHSQAFQDFVNHQLTQATVEVVQKQHQNNHQLHISPQSIDQVSPPVQITRKYQCKMCPQDFISKTEMKYHNQDHMKEAKPYKCSECPKAFANSSYLSQHLRIHQGVKPYSCETCSKKFTQLSHLQQHKRTHTGDKPYVCNYMDCTKKFSQLSNLQSHSRCHQLDKPYKCNSCYKSFQDEPSLLDHIPKHLESKHLKKNLCVFCGSSYQHQRGLVKHFQQIHTDKPSALVAAAIAAGTTGDMRLVASLVSPGRSQSSYSIGQENSVAASIGTSALTSSLNVTF